MLAAAARARWPGLARFMAWSVFLGAALPMAAPSVLVLTDKAKYVDLSTLLGNGECFLSSTFILVCSCERLFRVTRLHHVKAAEFYVVTELFLIIVGLIAWCGATASRLAGAPASGIVVWGGLVFFAIAACASGAFVSKLEAAVNDDSAVAVNDAGGEGQQ